MSESALAVQIANRALDNPSLDPDGDLCVLARQFLRLRDLLSKPDMPAGPQLVAPVRGEDAEAQRRLAEQSAERD